MEQQQSHKRRRHGPSIDTRLLSSVIQHTQAHNRILIEQDAWNARQKELEMEARLERGETDSSIPASSSCTSVLRPTDTHQVYTGALAELRSMIPSPPVVSVDWEAERRRSEEERVRNRTMKEVDMAKSAQPHVVTKSVADIWTRGSKDDKQEREVKADGEEDRKMKKKKKKKRREREEQKSRKKSKKKRKRSRSRSRSSNSDSTNESEPDSSSNSDDDDSDSESDTTDTRSRSRSLSPSPHRHRRKSHKKETNRRKKEHRHEKKRHKKHRR